MPIENLRVLHVIARYNVGGTARYLNYLLPDLASRDVEVVLGVGRVQSGEVEDASLSELKFRRIESLGRKISPWSDFKSFLEIKKLIRDFKPDLIHTHTFKAGALCRIMSSRIPKVHTFHGHLLTDPEFSNFRRKCIIICERLFAKRTQKLIVTGETVARDLLMHNIGKAEQYVSIPGQSFLKDLAPRQITRKKLGLTDEFTVLWAARVAKVKNPKLLLEVALLMPSCKFILAGDGSELESIRVTAPPNVILLGFVDIREILLAGDVFLSTSLNEGIPYSILEAQAAGLPVVAVNAGALEELVIDGFNGYLVKPTSNDVAAGILKLQESSEIRNKMALRAKVLVQQTLATDFAAKHMEIYRSILT